MQRLIRLFTFFLVFSGLVSFALAGGPQLGTVFVKTIPPGAKLSSEIISSGDGVPVLCHYSTDGGQSWMTAEIDVNYGISYCKAAPTYFNSVPREMILFKVITSLEQTAQSTPPAVDVLSPMSIAALSINPSVQDAAGETRYIPQIIEVAGQISGVVNGIDACNIVTGAAGSGGEQVSKITSGVFQCKKSGIDAIADAITRVGMQIVDNVGNNLNQYTPTLIIDTMPPVSTINTATASGTTINVIGNATDEQSGIRKMQLWYRKDSGSWKQAAEQLTEVPSGRSGPKGSQHIFTLDSNNLGGSGKYDFFVMSMDVIGNSEPARNAAQGSVTIAAAAAPIGVTATATVSATPIVEELTEITPTAEEKTPPKSLDAKQEFLMEWIAYKIDRSLSMNVELNTDNVIFDENGARRIRLFGYAPAGVEVRISIFSDQYEVTAVADANGYWSADVDQTLSDGAHSAYLYYLSPEQDFYRMEQEMILGVDLENRVLFSQLTLLPQSGVATTNGIIATILILFGTAMIVIAIAGFNYRRMFKSNEVIEVIRPNASHDGSGVMVVGQPTRYF